MSDVALSAAGPSAVRHSWLGWKVVGLLAPYRRTVAGLSLLILAAAGLDIAVPFITQNIIDRIIHSLQGVQRGSMRMLLLSALAIFAATACTRLLRSFYNYRLLRVASRAEDEVKNKAFANFLQLDTEFHGNVNTGEVVGALDRGGTAVYVILYEILGQ